MKRTHQCGGLIKSSAVVTDTRASCLDYKRGAIMAAMCMQFVEGISYMTSDCLFLIRNYGIKKISSFAEESSSLQIDILFIDVNHCCRLLVHLGWKPYMPELAWVKPFVCPVLQIHLP